MEALSRREEEEVEAACKTAALKQCDDFVRGQWALGVLTGRLCSVRGRTNVYHSVQVWGQAQGHEGVYEATVSGGPQRRGQEFPSIVDADIHEISTQISKQISTVKMAQRFANVRCIRCMLHAAYCIPAPTIYPLLRLTSA